MCLVVHLRVHQHLGEHPNAFTKRIDVVVLEQLPTNDVMSMLGMAIVPPHQTVLSLRMAVAVYVTGISTPEVHPEFPPLLGTLTAVWGTSGGPPTG